jgi:hypothetical protein
MKIIVFLQNAWSPFYAGKIWPRESWLRALATSRSGQRLGLICDSLNDVENTTAQVGNHPDSVCPPDKNHIKTVLKQRKPDVIITCGRQAEKALCCLWTGPIVSVPHPACRVLTNACYLKANSLLTDNYKDRLAVRQRKGKIEIEKL